MLGGGIGGLCSAYFLSKEFPHSKVTLFEAGKETGGWIQSRRVQVQGQEGKSGSVLFELGPRALMKAIVTAGLVRVFFCSFGTRDALSISHSLC